MRKYLWPLLADNLILLAGILLAVSPVILENWGIGLQSTTGNLARLALVVSGAILILAAIGLAIFPAARRRFYSETGIRRSRYFIQAGLWVGVVLVIMELALRAFVIADDIRISSDPMLGGAAAAGSSAFNGLEGTGYIHYIADGEIYTPYNEGPSILVLGDSNTEAQQVNDDQKFASVAESRLWSDGYRLNLRNLAISGYSLAHYAGLLPYFVKKYDPVAIVIQVSLQDFDCSDGFSHDARFYFLPDADGATTPVANPDPNAGLAHRVEVPFSLAIYTSRRLKEIFPAPASGSEMSSDPISTRDSIQIQLSALERVTDSLGIPVIFLALPDTPRIENGMIHNDDSDFDYLVSQIESRKGWQVVDPSREFLSLLTQGELPRGFNNTTPGIGHMTPDAHLIAGDLLAQKLEGLLK